MDPDVITRAWQDLIVLKYDWLELHGGQILIAAIVQIYLVPCALFLLDFLAF